MSSKNPTGFSSGNVKFKSKYMWVGTTVIFLLTNVVFGVIVGLATIMIFIQDKEIERLKTELKR